MNLQEFFDSLVEYPISWAAVITAGGAMVVMTINSVFVAIDIGKRLLRVASGGDYYTAEEELEAAGIDPADLSGSSPDDSGITDEEWAEYDASFEDYSLDPEITVGEIGDLIWNAIESDDYEEANAIIEQYPSLASEYDLPALLNERVQDLISQDRIQEADDLCNDYGLDKMAFDWHSHLG